MINKIKAEIERLKKEIHAEKAYRLKGEKLRILQGKEEELTKCLKWAEELEKELKEEVMRNLEWMTEDGNDVAYIKHRDLKPLMEKAFHGEEEAEVGIL